MKNVIVTTSLGSGGAERMLHRLLTCWQERRSCIIFNLTGEGQFSHKIRELGVPVYDLNLFKKPWNVFKMLTAILKEEVGAVWGWMYHGNLAAFFIKVLMRPRAKMIWNIRHTLYDLEREKRLTKVVIRLNSLLSFAADKILFNSQLAQIQHIEYGFRSLKCSFIPNGFEIDSLSKGERTPHDHLTVGHVARFHPMKNQKQMIEAFVEAAQVNDRLKFLLVGKGLVPENAELMQLIPPSLRDRFSLIGEQTDVYKYYYQMDLFVLFSSWGEAFPNVLVESILTGNLPISSDVGDARQIVNDSTYIVPIGGKRELTDKILAFASMVPEERKSRSESLKARMISNYSIESVANQFSQYLGK